MSTECVKCHKETTWDTFLYYPKRYGHSRGFWHVWCFEEIETKHKDKIPPCVI